jgi:hypothetical protein
VTQVVHDFLELADGPPNLGGGWKRGAQMSLRVVQRFMVQTDAVAPQFGRQTRLARTQQLAGLLVGVLCQATPL